MEKNRDALGLGNALKDSMLLWLLVPIFIPSVSCVIFSVYCTVTGNTKDLGLGNIDFINSILVLLVVLFLVLIVLGDKLAWLFFRKNVPQGQPADPARRILMLRDQLAQSAQLVRDSESAENWFAAEKDKFQRKKDFGLIMDQCVGSIEKLGGAQFRINHYALCERCRIPASKERITIDFELVEELLAGLQGVLSKLTWQRCVMIQKIYHDPNLLKPFQDMCDLFESMADQRDKDSQNATNDNHPEQFSDNYTDEKRASALAARFVDGLAKTWERKCAAEIKQLDYPAPPCFVGDVPTAVVSAAYPRLRAAIKAVFRPAIELAESAIRRCDEITPQFVKAKAAIRMDAIDGLGGDQNRDDPFNLVFATPDRMEDSLPDPESTEWHYNRILRPIAKDEEEIRKLLREKRGCHVCFGDRLWDALRPDRQPPARGFGEEIVREDIHSDGGLVEEFTFLKVLARNRPYWNARLLANDRISDRIRTVLGVEANDGVLPPPEVLIHTIAAKMCDSCLPWWRPKVGKAKTEENSVKAEKLAEEDNPTIYRSIDGTVFIPMTARGDTGAIAERAFRRVRPFPSRKEENVQIRWNVVWSSEREPLSPFAVVSFIEEAAPEKTRGKTGRREHPLDGILSFDYWKDPQIEDLLREAERPDGALVFSDNLGYISPRFVRDQAVSAKRWKPWVKERKTDLWQVFSSARLQARKESLGVNHDRNEN